jgi:hypothetical protein
MKTYEFKFRSGRRVDITVNSDAGLEDAVKIAMLLSDSYGDVQEIAEVG